MEFYCQSENDLFAQEVSNPFLSSSPSVTAAFGGREEFHTSSLPSDDIWKKFELETPPTSPTPEIKAEFDIFGFAASYSIDDHLFNSELFSTLQEDPAFPGSQSWSFSREARELRHDCMWAGECCSAEHVKVRPRSTSRKASVRVDTPVTDVEERESDADSDNSVLSTDVEPKVCMIRGTRPDSLLKPMIAVNAGKKIGIKNIKPEPASDHSYFAAKREETDIDVESFGLQTPSDSEEEIDVVGDQAGVVPGTTVRKVSGPGQSLRLKLRVPATQDPEELQRRIAAAIQAAQRSSAQLLASNGKKFCYQIAKGRPPKKFPTDSLPSPSTTKRKHDSGESSNSSPSKKSSRGSDSDDPEKRSIHNCMERKRRVDLRNAFDSLRAYIPDLRDTERVSKVTILKKATLYSQALSAVDKRLSREKVALAKQRDALRSRLEALQRL